MFTVDDLEMMTHLFELSYLIHQALHLNGHFYSHSQQTRRAHIPFLSVPSLGVSCKDDSVSM